MASPYDMGNVTMNGTYTPCFYLDNMYADYKQAGLTKIIDNPIPEHKYIGEIAPGVLKLTRLIMAEYDERYVNGADFAANVAKVGAEFNIEIFATEAEAADWIRFNTSCDEVEPGFFEFVEASVDMYGNEVPAITISLV